MEVLLILDQHKKISENMLVFLIVITIASTSYKNCFYSAGVPLTRLINQHALSLAKNISIIPLGLF